MKILVSIATQEDLVHLALLINNTGTKFWTLLQKALLK